MPKHSEDDHRKAINNLAKRIYDSHKKSGDEISFERAQRRARESAHRHDRRNE